MLRKLLKYEFKSSSRAFLPLYAAIIIVAPLLAVTVQIQSDWLGVVIGLLFVGLIMSLCVLTLLNIVQRFNKNLLSDEGYLMFTLPVPTWKLIMSKLITNIVWVCLSFLTAVISGIVIALIISNVSMNDVKFAWYELSQILQKVSGQQFWQVVGTALNVIVALLIQFTAFVMVVYFSISITQMPVFHKHRGAFAFLAFIVLQILYTTIVGNVFIGNSFINSGSFFGETGQINTMLMLANISNLVWAALNFAGTTYVLGNHLNLE